MSLEKNNEAIKLRGVHEQDHPLSDAVHYAFGNKVSTRMVRDTAETNVHPAARASNVDSLNLSDPYQRSVHSRAFIHSSVPTDKWAPGEPPLTMSAFKEELHKRTRTVPTSAPEEPPPSLSIHLWRFL